MYSGPSVGGNVVGDVKSGTRWRRFAVVREVGARFSKIVGSAKVSGPCEDDVMLRASF